MGRPAPDFYEIQGRQRRKSLLVLGMLVLFYFAAIGLLTLAALATVGLFSAGGSLLSARTLGRFLLFDLLLSVLVAAFHFQDARRFGAKYILDRLQASPPDPADLYHARFRDTLEEMRIGAGAPRVAAYVLPFSAVNSMGLIEADGTPAVAVTEGLLAGATRDELQAVAAHELAHILRGDAVFVTLVCSLGNVFERMRDALEPEAPEGPAIVTARAGRRGGGGAPLVYAVAALASVVMRLLGTLLSRERELLADAAAVEFGRDPAALAGIIYKAHVSNSFVGDFAATYAPLFIVAPDSRAVRETWPGRLFNTHPPVMTRVSALAAMAGLKPGDIVRRVLDAAAEREKARTVLRAAEESGGSAASAPAELEAPPGTGPKAARVWQVRGPHGGWEGPMSALELVSLPWFTSMVVVRNIQEKAEAKAREFPQVREAMRGPGKGAAGESGGKCPRCRVPLAEVFYEGVEVKACPRCRGRSVPMAMMDRIIARREVAFSEALVRKAEEFKARFLAQPVLTKKVSETASPEPLPCPECGRPLKPRPYSYAFFLPVDKCLACHGIWFDADELEILQVLVENR